MNTRFTPRFILLLSGAAILGALGGAWLSERVALSNLSEALKQNVTANEIGLYQPRSESGAFLIAQYAEHGSDWQMTHNALMYLEQTVGLPETQNARLFLAAIASGDWATARTMQSKHPEAITGSAPLVRMLAAILDWSDGDKAGALTLLQNVPYHPVTQPILPFVTGWMTRETPQLSLMDAAQDIAFSTLNMVRFFEATKQYERADALMIKLQEAELSLRLQTWSIAYFERRGLTAEAVKAKAKFADQVKTLSPTLWKQEQARILAEADGHLKSDKRALALTLIDATDFLQAHNASAIALLYVQLAKKLVPDLTGADITLASVYESQENWDQAYAIYNNVPSNDPASMTAQLRAADVLNRAGRLDEAKAAYEKLTSRYSDSPEVWFERGEFLRTSMNAYGDAIKAYDKVEALFKGNIPDLYWALYLARGLCYDLSNQPDKAITDYEDALKLQPENPEALNTLAYAWAEKGKNLDRAQSMAEEALMREPDAAHIIDTMGWVLYRRGEPAKAIPFIERASQMMPYDATVNDHLGDVYKAAGRDQEAAFMWQRAVSFADNEKQRADIQAKLDQ